MKKHQKLVIYGDHQADQQENARGRAKLPSIARYVAMDNALIFSTLISYANARERPRFSKGFFQLTAHHAMQKQIHRWNGRQCHCNNTAGGSVHPCRSQTYRHFAARPGPWAGIRFSSLFCSSSARWTPKTRGERNVCHTLARANP